MHGTEHPSAWVQRWAHLIRPQGRVLDVACGAGRHMRFLAALGHPVTGVDRNEEALALAAPAGQTVLADIENGPWPFAGQTFDAVVVTNYLWRPLLPALLHSVALKSSRPSMRPAISTKTSVPRPIPMACA